MLSLPRFTQSLLNSFDDDFHIYPLDYVLPKGNTLATTPKTQLAVPVIKDNKYNLALDLSHFEPSEIKVKLDKSSLQISGKHEKKSEDGTHYEFREYNHHFSVPDNVDHEKLKCQLDKKGFLKIEAPIKGQVEEGKGRSIPIEFVKK